MFQAPIVLLTLAIAPEDCDLRATIAGELMGLRQSGAGTSAITAAALSTSIPDFASSLLDRVLAAETSGDASARELAAFHFAAEIHAECLATDPLMS